MLRAIWTMALSLALLPANAANAGDLSGEWSYQALNAEDTNFKVEQKGAEVTFYRQLHPEFEGKRYLLEHLYRGKLAGQKVQGKMFVREEGMRDFEFLRPFDGVVKSPERMVMDEMPLKRVTPAAPGPSDGVDETPAQTRYAKVVVKRPADKTASASPAPPEAASPAPPGQAAPDRIPNLIPVANQVQTESGRAADAAMRAGDVAYARKDYAEALQQYEEALRQNPQKVEALYKIGLCNGVLGDRMTRAGKVEGATDHLKRAVEVWQRAVRLDPYNTGAKENIRRAEAKLQKLEYR